jgi:hypothetical protein
MGNPPTQPNKVPRTPHPPNTNKPTHKETLFLVRGVRLGSVYWRGVGGVDRGPAEAGSPHRGIYVLGVFFSWVVRVWFVV